MTRSLVSLCLCSLLACSFVYVVSLALVYLGDFFSISGHVCFKISINGKLYVFRPRRRLHLRRTTLQEMGSSMKGCQSFVSFMIRIPFPQMLIERQFLDCLDIQQQDSRSLWASWHLRRCNCSSIIVYVSKYILVLSPGPCLTGGSWSHISCNSRFIALMFHSPNLVLSLLFEILVLLFLSMLAFHVRLVAFLALLGLSLRFFTRIALVIFALLFILAMLRLLRIILVPWALHS